MLAALYAQTKARKGVLYEADDFIPHRETEDTDRYKRRKQAMRIIEERKKRRAV